MESDHSLSLQLCFSAQMLCTALLCITVLSATTAVDGAGPELAYRGTLLPFVIGKCLSPQNTAFLHLDAVWCSLSAVLRCAPGICVTICRSVHCLIFVFCSVVCMCAGTILPRPPSDFNLRCSQAPRCSDATIFAFCLVSAHSGRIPPTDANP